MTRFLILCCFFLQIVFQASFSQNRVSGIIVDSRTLEPIEYASISLLSLPDSVIKSNELSDINGRFSFKKLNKSKYSLRVVCIGYLKSYIDFDVKKERSDISLDTIELNVSSIKLADFKITANSNIIERADRTIYTITKDMLSISSSSLDLLKQIPLVQYDPINKLTLEGSSKVKVLVDGKSRSTDFLEQIQAQDVESVEIITNPLKYGSEYVGAINIILKRGTLNNIKSSLITNFPLQHASFDGKSLIGLEYGKKKLRLYIGGKLTNTKAPILIEKTRNIFSLDTSSYITNGNGNFTQNGYEINGGIDYFADDKNYLNFHSSFNAEKGKDDFFVSNNYIHGIETINAKIFVNDDKYKRSNNYNLYFQHKFDKTGHELTFETNYFNNGNSKDINNNKASIFNGANDLLLYSTLDQQTVLFKRNSLEVKTDYSLPINQQYTFESGVTYYYQNMNNSFNKNNYFRPQFNYSESRKSGYSEILYKKNKLRIMVGLRVEASTVYINDTIRNTHLFPIPMFNLIYRLKTSQTIKLNYSRNITRPNNRDLDPFVIKNDTFEVTHGNPYLKPAVSNKFRLSYTLLLSEKIYFAPSLYYSFNKDIISRFVTLKNENLKESYPVNLLNGNETGFTFYAKVLYVNFDFTYFKSYTQSHSKDGYYIKSYSKNGFRSKSTFIIPLPFSSALFYSITYNSSIKSGQTETYTQGIQYLGYQLPLKKYNIDVQSFVFMPFKNRWVRSRETTKADYIFEQSTKSLVVNNGVIMIQISYRFNRNLNIKSINREKQLDSD